jgi:hypothetical protein
MTVALDEIDLMYHDLGKDLGRLYTDNGVSLDQAMKSLGVKKKQKLIVLEGACEWFIDHKKAHGATVAEIRRQRSVNRKMIEQFKSTGKAELER